MPDCSTSLTTHRPLYSSILASLQGLSTSATTSNSSLTCRPWAVAVADSSCCSQPSCAFPSRPSQARHSHVAQLNKAIPHLSLASHTSHTTLSHPPTPRQDLDMEQYIHRRLDTKSSGFRLVRIDKTPEETSLITLTLRHAQLNEEEGKFHALSYAWGDEHPKHEIVINDSISRGTFRVRQNLYDYLSTARKLKDERTTEWIWIDQICIDQIHHSEKCHQVGQMGQLYSTAMSTISWPGRLRAWRDPRPREYTHGGMTFTPQAAEKISHPSWKMTRKLLQGPFTDLVSSSYWSRTWIIQEIVLAQKHQILIVDEF